MDVNRLTLEDEGSIIELPVAVQSPDVNQEVDLLLRLVTEDTLAQLQLARVDQAARQQMASWKTAREQDSVILYAPDKRQESIMAGAIMSALVFERNGIVQRVNQYIRALDTVPTPTSADVRVGAILRLLGDDIQMRGPCSSPTNWKLAVDNQTTDDQLSAAAATK